MKPNNEASSRIRLLSGMYFFSCNASYIKIQATGLNFFYIECPLPLHLLLIHKAVRVVGEGHVSENFFHLRAEIYSIKGNLQESDHK